MSKLTNIFLFLAITIILVSSPLVTEGVFAEKKTDTVKAKIKGIGFATCETAKGDDCGIGKLKSKFRIIFSVDEKGNPTCTIKGQIVFHNSDIQKSVLKQLDGKPFCTPLPMEDPFQSNSTVEDKEGTQYKTTIESTKMTVDDKGKITMIAKTTLVGSNGETITGFSLMTIAGINPDDIDI